MDLSVCNQCGGTGASHWGRRPDDATSWCACEKCRGTGGLVMQERQYHFSCGNSTTGPIGLCGTVRARSRDEAVQIFRNHVFVELDADIGDSSAVDYMRVYIDPSNITINDIDMIDGEDVEREAA